MVRLLNDPNDVQRLRAGKSTPMMCSDDSKKVKGRKVLYTRVYGLLRSLLNVCCLCLERLCHLKRDYT